MESASIDVTRTQCLTYSDHDFGTGDDRLDKLSAVRLHTFRYRDGCREKRCRHMQRGWFVPGITTGEPHRSVREDDTITGKLTCNTNHCRFCSTALMTYQSAKIG